MGAIISVLGYTLPALKYTAVALVLLNLHSFPLTWHIRHWWRLIPLHLSSRLRSPHAHLLSASHSARLAGGAALRVTQRRRALPDDCDFNYHLSNSCYAKNSDISRSQWAFDAITPVLMSGGFLALGASHYVFVREIPMWAGYEMETRVVGWGDKWFFLVTEFLIRPKPKKTPRSGTHGAASPPSPPVISSGSATPASIALPTSPSLPTSSGNAGSTTALSLSAATAALRHSDSDSSPSVLNIADSLRTRSAVRSDGRVVAAYGIVEMCFKTGRITIPPRVAFHLCGLSPVAAEQQRAAELTRDPRAAKRWLAGGWREASDADDIGRDIDPATPLPLTPTLATVSQSSNGVEKPSTSTSTSASASAGASDSTSARAVNDQVAEAMERVSAGLAGAVHN